MKVLFNIAHLANRGGKERVLVNKANYMAEQWGADVIVVTTEQQGRPCVYPLSDKVKHIDLDVCYECYRKLGVVANWLAQRRCVQRHRRELAALLRKERPDITISMFGREVVWLPKIDDGSKKILEFHFTRDFLKQDARKQPLLWLKYWVKLRAIRHYDRFVVLTNEERRLWKEIDRVTVIPNALTFYPTKCADLQQKRVLAVGRLCQEKGFDRLLEIWRDIAFRFPDWELCIVGDGLEKEHLTTLIEQWGLVSTVRLLPATSTILNEYLSASIYVMTSRNEGFGMVLLEAMACGLPVVAYACKCGPREIIRDGEDGFLIENGNTSRFVEQLSLLMERYDKRVVMGEKARRHIMRFSEEQVMSQWKSLYESLL